MEAGGKAGMKQSKIIGITGGIATGKSTAVEYLKSKGYPIIDSDQIAHKVLESPMILKNIKTIFGEKFFKNGKLNRKIFSNYVFNDKKELKKLEELVYPFIIGGIHQRIVELKDKFDFIFVDIPLLFEKKNELNLTFDSIWLIYTDEPSQIDRMIRERGLTEEEAKSRIKAQMPIEGKKQLADVIICNQGSKDELYQNIEINLKK
ncbi:dephospho-CoA kinase [Peptostreptococcaceae bacterium oral taxon 113 str. W5053]|nr:dephospho-CoA kinase [Peptostreptococcaceae bacterium oral taxon 113 str. W5053]